MAQIGFDIGGTNIKAGIIDENFRVLAESEWPFPRGEEPSAVVQWMDIMVSELLQASGLSKNDMTGMGIAVPGSLDPENEVVIHAHNLNFHQVPFKKILEEKFPGIPLFLANDANAAALGELRMGALHGCNTAVLVTLGTGVGGGLILGGKLFNGGLGHGVELGHVRLIHDGPICSCGNQGCLETVCSAQFFERRGLVTKDVMDSAKEGNTDSMELFQEYLGYLSDALVSIAMLLDPEVIALGGGISQAGDFLFEPLRKMVEEKSFFKYPHKIVPAKLGNKAGFLGAAMLSRE